MPKCKSPGKKLTVVLRNDGPLFYCGDSPTYRSVTIHLKDDQLDQLQLKYTHSSGKDEYFEEISRCFIEPED